MQRDNQVYLEDILEASHRILTYTKDLDLSAFSKDHRTVDAVVRNLEIIGEAVKKLSEETRKRRPEIEWKKISGLRDILIHEYYGIDYEIIWDIIKNKLPVLETATEALRKA